MVENVFKDVHEKQLEELRKKSDTPQPEEKELDGKMDRKKFLEYVLKSVFF